MEVERKYGNIEYKFYKKYYGTGKNQVKALDGVDLTVNKGDFIIIKGASGSGKSTLLKVLCQPLGVKIIGTY